MHMRDKRKLTTVPLSSMKFWRLNKNVFYSGQITNLQTKDAYKKQFPVYTHIQTLNNIFLSLLNLTYVHTIKELAFTHMLNIKEPLYSHTYEKEIFLSTYTCKRFSCVYPTLSANGLWLISARWHSSQQYKSKGFILSFFFFSYSVTGSGR